MTWMRRCHCCEDQPPPPGQCACSVCEGDPPVAACCMYVIDSNGDYTYYNWDENCRWVSGGEEITLHSDDGGATYIWRIEFGGVTYTAPAGAPPIDCLGASGTASSGGPEPDITFAAAEDPNECRECGCACSECADVVSGLNAACCLRMKFEGFTNGSCLTCTDLNRTVYAKKITDCSWQGQACGICGANGTATATYTAGQWSISYAGYTFTKSVDPDGVCCPQQMTGWTVSGTGECDSTNATLTLDTVDEENCGCNEQCASMTISGVVNGATADECPCPSCGGLNSTSFLRPIGQGCSWAGTICHAGRKYTACNRYSDTRIWWEGNVLYASLSGGTDGGFVKWSVTVPVGTPKDQIARTLAYHSGSPAGGFWNDCDFTASTVTLATFADDCDCGVIPCEDPVAPVPWCNCADDAQPNRYIFDVGSDADYDCRNGVAGAYICDLPSPIPCDFYIFYFAADSSYECGPAPGEDRPFDAIQINLASTASIDSAAPPGTLGRSFMLYGLYRTDVAIRDGHYYDWMNQACYYDHQGTKIIGRDCMLINTESQTVYRRNLDYIFGGAGSCGDCNPGPPTYPPCGTVCTYPPTLAARIN